MPIMMVVMGVVVVVGGVSRGGCRSCGSHGSGSCGSEDGGSVFPLCLFWSEACV